jgi:tape measure domain-containing protein
VAANDTRRLRVVVTGDSGQAQQSLEQVGEAAQKTESKFVTLAKGIATWGARGALALGAIGGAAVTMGVSTASQLEQVRVGFTTMLGSAQKADKFLKQLQKFAAATPFEFTELTGAAQKFLAMGFSAEKVIPMLTAVGDAVAAMGGSAEQIDTVTTALTQMQVKGKVSGEEIMQLSEQGIPALQILADNFGVTVSEMSKMISNGDVMASKAIPMIIDGLENGTKSVKGFGGMMAKQSETMKGKWSTLMDTLQMGLGNIATKFLPAAKVGIDLLSSAFSNFFGGLEGKGKLSGLGGTFNELGLGIRAAADAFKEGDVTSDGLVGKFETLGVWTRKLVDAFNAAKDATVSVIGWLREHDRITQVLIGSTAALVAITKVHATVTGIQAAGGLFAMFKNLSIVAATMKVAAAVQWAWNGAVAAASYLQIAGYLAALNIAAKANVVWTKLMTAGQWLWNAAMTANPIGIVIAAVAALVAAVVYLWKNNEGFRNWVLNVLWPSLQKAWEQLKTAFMAVVNAMVAAWNWLKDSTLAVWNAIVNFLRPIVNTIVAIFGPIVMGIMKIYSTIWAFFTNAWKVVWILIQIAVKVFVFYFQNVLWPAIKWVIDAIGGVIRWLYNNVWKPNWDAMQWIANKVVSWFTGTLVPAFSKAWGWIKTGLSAVKNFFVISWNIIRDKVSEVFNKIAGPYIAIFNAALNKVKGWLNTFKAAWFAVFNATRDKLKSVMDSAAHAFSVGVTAIGKAWNKLKDVAKAPVNFVINDIYNSKILPLWNKVAEKFGIKTRLDPIKGFAKGGVVGHGYGYKDDQLALLMRGEGILTTKEMQKIGGPRGFQEFRASLAQYGNGGVVGGDGPGSWFKSLVNKGKDIFQGVAGSVIKPLVNSLRGFINDHLPSGGFSGLMRGGANTILDKLMSWVSGKDKEIGSIGGAGGAMGWAAMRALISGRFPGLGMISGFRPGARTLTGNRSYHSVGRAVDYPPVRALAQWIRGTFGAKTKELITPWQDLNLWNGKPHRYHGAVWNQHNFAGGNAHVHWAMDTASEVDPGWFLGYNGTGKPETLVNADKYGGNVFNVAINVNGAGDPKRVAKEIRDELIKLGDRNGGRTGLPKK